MAHTVTRGITFLPTATRIATLNKCPGMSHLSGSLEGCLKGPIEHIANHARMIEAGALTDLHLLPARSAGVWHETDHHRDDHQPSDAQIDPHIWVSPVMRSVWSSISQTNLVFSIRPMAGYTLPTVRIWWPESKPWTLNLQRNWIW